MGSDHPLLMIAPVPSLDRLAFSLGSYDAPPPSSHSKEPGQSRWLVFTCIRSFMARFLFSQLILLFVCFMDCFVLYVLTTSLLLTLGFPVPWELDYILLVSTRDASLQSRYGCPCSMSMTSETGRIQVLAKRQGAFTRLNGNQPGIAGLMNFTKVRGVFLRCPGIIYIVACFCDGWMPKYVFTVFRRGSLPGSTCTLSISTIQVLKRTVRYLRSTLVDAHSA